MKIHEMNWLQVEDYLKRDDRAVLPLGSTEQHAYLSLCVDNILAERVATEAAEAAGIPVFPTVNYGLTPYFRAYPGSVTLRTATYLNIVKDLLDSLAESGFRRILIVNGHGGNLPAQGFVSEWMADNPGCRVKFHNWWSAPRTLQKVQEIDPQASHASWMENFPWTRLPDVALPSEQKPMIDAAHMRLLAPQELREYLKEGNFGGYYERP
jgi:creatinine amidohydrolase